MTKSNSTCVPPCSAPAMPPRRAARSGCCGGCSRCCGWPSRGRASLVRLDGGFATPEVFAFLDAEPALDYIVAIGENAVLTRLAEPAMAQVRPPSDASERTEHRYLDGSYAAGTRPQARRVVIKAEVVRLPGRPPRDNARFVITNLRQTPRFVYEQVYCARGDIENRIASRSVSAPAPANGRVAPSAADPSGTQCRYACRLSAPPACRFPCRRPRPPRRT